MLTFLHDEFRLFHAAAMQHTRHAKIRVTPADAAAV